MHHFLFSMAKNLQRNHMFKISRSGVKGSNDILEIALHV